MGNGAGAFLWGALIVFIIISIAIEFPLIRWFLVIGLIVVIGTFMIMNYWPKLKNQTKNRILMIIFGIFFISIFILLYLLMY